MTNMTDQNNQVDFSQLFEELGLTNLTTEQKEAYSKQLMDMLQERIDQQVSSRLTDKDRPFIEGKSEQEVAEYLDSIGINLAEIAVVEGMKLREELLSTMSYAEGVIENISKSEDSE